MLTKKQSDDKETEWLQKRSWKKYIGDINIDLVIESIKKGQKRKKTVLKSSNVL